MGQPGCRKIQHSDYFYQTRTFCFRSRGQEFAYHSFGFPPVFDETTVFIRAQPEVENGEIAAIEFLDGSSCKATLKRFHREGNKVMLSPENAKYSPMIFVGEEINKIKVVGKAVYFLSEIK